LLNAKRLELLREVTPQADVIAALLNPHSPRAESDSAEIQRAARELGLRVPILHATDERDFEAVFATLIAHGAKSLLVAPDPMFFARRHRLTELATHYSIPALYFSRTQVEVGGLMSYGANTLDVYRQLGLYAGKIVSGTKPADLPVMMPTKFEFVINLKTAKALGLQIPDKLLALADEVIE